MKKEKRDIDILVLSDIHLGTYGCHAEELLCYLKSIKPEIVILNGDIIDIWRFNKFYWPKSHMKIIQHFLKWIGKGIKIYYITGNHDEMIRKFSGLNIGSMEIKNKLILDLPDNKKAWIFHGDIFDIYMTKFKFLSRIGSIGYDILVLINKIFNFISEKILKKNKISLSKKIKESVKAAISFINNFENVIAGMGIENKFDYVICGHIHHPEIKIIENKDGSIVYLNSGDWVENLTSLEFFNNEWSIYKYSKLDFEKNNTDDSIDGEYESLDNREIFNKMLYEFKNLKK